MTDASCLYAMSLAEHMVDKQILFTVGNYLYDTCSTLFLLLLSSSFFHHCHITTAIQFYVDSVAQAIQWQQHVQRSAFIYNISF